MPTDCPIPATGECMPADRCIDFALGFALWLVIVILIHYLKRCCKVGGRMEWSFSAPALRLLAPAPATADPAAPKDKVL
ncbi:unnamed protein product [Brassica rapa subsp. trilocularis]